MAANMSVNEMLSSLTEFLGFQSDGFSIKIYVRRIWGGAELEPFVDWIWQLVEKERGTEESMLTNYTIKIQLTVI